MNLVLFASVGDLWHFGADPDPRIRIPRSVRLTYGSGSGFNSGSDSFLHSLFFHIFFISCPQLHYLEFKKLNFLLKFCVKILLCGHFFSPLNTFMRKFKDPEPDPHLWLMDTDPGGPKTGGSGSGSPTLLFAALTFSFVLQDLRRPARVVTILPFVWRGWPIQANSTSALENIEEYQYNILMSILRKMSETVC